ncbi:PIN domain-containing protein [Cnuibacter sp. UC19_7]|uniref:PIN domain-containing protein n=1 Tax=Cnuibacter sp. UC19_7 TaxID=3350166 RepID=UPI00366BEC15
MRAVLDTNILIAGAFAPAEGVTEVAISSVSYAELRFGIAAVATDPVRRVERQLRFDAIAERFGAGLPFDDRAAVHYGYLTELVLAAGRSPRGRALDLMIAAVALSNEAALVTRNPHDFQGLGSVLRVLPG